MFQSHSDGPRPRNLVGPSRRRYRRRRPTLTDDWPAITNERNKQRTRRGRRRPVARRRFRSFSSLYGRPCRTCSMALFILTHTLTHTHTRTNQERILGRRYETLDRRARSLPFLESLESDANSQWCSTLGSFFSPLPNRLLPLHSTTSRPTSACHLDSIHPRKMVHTSETSIPH